MAKKAAGKTAKGGKTTRTKAGSPRRAVKKSEITEDTPLLPMELRFADEFLIDYNQTNAAIRAGYSPKNARNIASRLKRQVNVSAYIARKIAETSTRTGIEFERIMKEAARIAFVNPLNVFNPEEGSLNGDVSDDDAAAISGLKVKQMSGDDYSSTEREIKFHAKDKALDLILKYAKASAEFAQKMEIEKEKLTIQREQLALEERRLAILEEKERKEKAGNSIILNILDPFGDNDETVSKIPEETPAAIVQNDEIRQNNGFVQNGGETK